MPITLDGTNGITQAGEFNSDSTFGFKNRIINGAMVIDQRNAGASVTPTGTDQYTLDRWCAFNNITSKFSVQQSSTAPTGFSNSTLITSLSAYTPASDKVLGFGQLIEGFNFYDMGWGTANAKTVTLSFWVRSSLTGTFSGALRNSAANRSYPFTYSISAANTFEYKTVTIAGDTSGTWVGATNGVGVLLNFDLGSGSGYQGTANQWSGTNLLCATGTTQLVATNGATWYVTGCQLEIGSTATSFDYRPYGTELQLCQRYCYVASSEFVGTVGGNAFVVGGALFFPQVMRTAPSFSGGSFSVSTGSAGTFATQNISTRAAQIYNSAGNWTAPANVLYSATISAEL